MEKELAINTRLGLRQVNIENIIHFPKGLAGLDGLHEYVLLEIRPEVPMLILQSIQTEAIGLVVVDPRTYILDYKYTIDPSELTLLCLEDDKDLILLVTVSTPHGKPEQTSLNLTGPILINPKKKIGLQIMQINNNGPRQFKLSQLMDDNTLDKNQAQPKPIQKDTKETIKVDTKESVKIDTKESVKKSTKVLGETSKNKKKIGNKK